MDENGALLKAIAENLKSGSDGLVAAASKADDRFLMREITCRLDGYARLARECEDKMRLAGEDVPKYPVTKKLRTRGALAVGTVLDGTTEHLASILAKGASSAADSLERRLAGCAESAGADAVALCRSVIEFERETAGGFTDFTVS